MDPAEQRARIEAALGDDGRYALEWICTQLEVPRASWRRVPPIRSAFDTAAVRRLTLRIQAEGRYKAWTPAYAEACSRLGLSEKSVADRDARWFTESRRAA
jgi:DNA polymerase III epsilon subunit-like protein